MPGGEVIVEAVDGVAVSNNKTVGQSPVNGPTLESSWWEKALARSANFKRDVAALMQPSGSAIFMVLHATDATKALKQLRNYGDTIVHTSLTGEQELATDRGNRS
jgi:hypothetical protein